MDKLIIQVALNEYTTRVQNPHVPLSPEEIARDAYACYNAGASVVHFHPRDPKTHLTSASDTASYIETLQLIRAKCDMVFYPTYDGALPVERQQDHVRQLTQDQRSRLEVHLIAIGAYLPATYDATKRQFLRDQTFTYRHTDFVPFFEFCNQSGLKPFLIVKEVGHVRHTLLYREIGLLKDPIVCHLRFPDTETFGPPPNADGIRAYLSAVPAGVPFHWFTQVYGRPHYRMNALAIAMGGHARTGIGEVVIDPAGPEPNAKMVERIASMAKAIGRDIATPDEARRMLGVDRRERDAAATR